MEELRPDLVLGCGGLPADYLETLAVASGAPVLYVPGAHDPAPAPAATDDTTLLAPPGPHGCINIDGRVVTGSGLNVAGMGGGLALESAPNRYRPKEMDKRVARFRFRHGRRRITGRRPPDVLVTHLSPLPIDGRPADHHPKLVQLVRSMKPRIAVHGGHGRGYAVDDRRIGKVPVIHPMPYRVLDLD